MSLHRAAASMLALCLGDEPPIGSRAPRTAKPINEKKAAQKAQRAARKAARKAQR